jgi:hypothetical protein
MMQQQQMMSQMQMQGQQPQEANQIKTTHDNIKGPRDPINNQRV